MLIQYNNFLHLVITENKNEMNKGCMLSDELVHKATRAKKILSLNL
jgi:hypothetical protein